MKNVYLPNYKDGSIVNLMSSITRFFGAKTQYAPLKLLPPEKLKDSKNVALIVLDGLGFEHFKRNCKGTILNKHLLGSITSVFLPTTVSAITTFLTGTAPQQHAFTGWFMHLKEVGVVSKILRFSPKYGGDPFSRYGIEMKDILNQQGFSAKIKAKSFSINHRDIISSDFNKLVSEKSKNLSYTTLNGFFRQIKKAVNSGGNSRKYIYAYWPELDILNHEHGVGSKKSEKHFKEIDKKFQSLIKSIKNTNTALIITADHGFVNTSSNRTVKLEDHPKMKECLTLPLCGEKRIAYCYVHPSKAKDFEKYARTKLKKYCYCHKSRDLIDKNYFGLFEPNKNLFDRIGDYILILKENYIIKDSMNMKRQKIDRKIGRHGGISKEEMLVPLIFIAGED